MKVYILSHYNVVTDRTITIGAFQTFDLAIKAIRLRHAPAALLITQDSNIDGSCTFIKVGLGDKLVDAEDRYAIDRREVKS